MTDRRVQVLVTIQDMLEEVCPLVHEAMNGLHAIHTTEMRYRIRCQTTATDTRTLFFDEPATKPSDFTKMPLLDGASLLGISDRTRLLADLWSVVIARKVAL